jgi:hypothetical protein
MAKTTAGKTRDDWENRAQFLRWPANLVINGEGVPALDDGPWPRMAPKQRKALTLRWADLVEAHRDELALMVSLEMGKPIDDAWGIELRAVLVADNSE